MKLRHAAALCLLSSVVVFAQEKSVFEGLPALLLSNDRIALTLIPQGGAMAQIVLAGDNEHTNPLWNPLGIARQAGLKPPANQYRGHFICVDGFGPSSPEERDAGMPMHGEAHTLPWTLAAFAKEGATTSARFTVTLPLAQENLTRTYRVVDGESVVWVDTELENLLAFDRPVFWGEHASVGAPFLEPGKVVVDMPVSKARTRHHGPGPNPTRRLQPSAEFTWPMAPTVDGDMFDVRSAPMTIGSNDHTTSLLDPSRRLVYVTALHLEKKLIVGWVFRREEFPWVQTWLSYPGPNRMARGLEFATQPFDVPRSEVLRNGPMFDTPTFRVLPAKSKITAGFLMFYTRVPDGFQRVDDITLEGGKLTILDRAAAKIITLAASRSL